MNCGTCPYPPQQLREREHSRKGKSFLQGIFQKSQLKTKYVHMQELIYQYLSKVILPTMYLQQIIFCRYPNYFLFAYLKHIIFLLKLRNQQNKSLASQKTMEANAEAVKHMNAEEFMCWICLLWIIDTGRYIVVTVS